MGRVQLTTIAVSQVEWGAYSPPKASAYPAFGGSRDMDGAGYRRTAWIEVAELTYNNGSEKEEQGLDWGSADQSTKDQTNKAAIIFNK
jgi:hypothetical protein